MLTTSATIRAMAAMTWRSSWLPSVLIIAAALVLIIAATYWRQLGGLPRRWRWLLPLLRACALVALVAALLKPAIVRPKTVQEQGTVLVLIDRSRSMSVRDFTCDTPATHAQLVAMADALGRLPAGSRASVAGLYEMVQKLGTLADQAINLRNELDFARISGRGADAAQSRLDSAIATLHAAITAAKDKSTELGGAATGDLWNLLKRLDRMRPASLQSLRDEIELVARKTLASQISFDERLYQQNPKVRTVCEQLAGLSRFQIAESALLDPKHGILARLDARTPVAVFAFGDELTPISIDRQSPPATLNLDPSGGVSDIPSAIRRATEQIGSRPPQAIVILSDGRQIGHDRSAIAGAPAPVLAVPIAAPNLRDLSIASLRVPDLAFASETFAIRVEPRASGINIREISDPAKLDIDSATVDTHPLVGRDDRLDPFEFRTRIDQGGVHRIDVSLPQIKGEATIENNQARRYIKVVAGKLRVWLISGATGWDWRYLRDALASTSWIELQQELLAPGAAATADARQMLSQDMLILSDVAPVSLSLEQRQSLRRAIEDRGAGLLLITADPQIAEQWSQDTVLAPLLPYDRGRALWRTWPGEDPTYRVQIAAGAENSEALRLDPEAAISRQRWNDLRPFFRFLAMPPLRSTARPLLIERESRLPILTEMPAGRGRVYTLCTNETWRWRQRVGGRDQDRFFRQLVRAGAAAPYAITDVGLSLDVDRVTAAPDQPVRIRARAGVQIGQRQSLPLQILREGQVIRTEDLLPSSGAEGLYEATLRDLSPGEFEVFLPDPLDDLGQSGPRLPLHITDNSEAEMSSISGDESILRNLASASGGKVLSLGDIAAVPQSIADAASRQPQTVETRLWDSYYLYFFVVGCLAAEWGVRKRLGMA